MPADIRSNQPNSTCKKPKITTKQAEILPLSFIQPHSLGQYHTMIVLVTWVHKFYMPCMAHIFGNCGTQKPARESLSRHIFCTCELLYQDIPLFCCSSKNTHLCAEASWHTHYVAIYQPLCPSYVTNILSHLCIQPTGICRPPRPLLSIL